MLKKVFSAALCCLPLGLLAQPLTNPGFEQGAASWNLPQPICQIAPGEGRNGTAALVWENTDTSLPLPRPRATQELKLQANQTYRISCFVKGRIDQLDRFNIGASFYLQIMNGNDVISYLYVRGMTQSSEEWQYVSKDFTFPPNADRCIVSAGIHHLGTGKAYFDDFNLENLNEYFIYMTSPGMGTVFLDDPTVRAAVYYTGPELPAGLQARLTVAGQAVLAAITDSQAVFRLPELPVGPASARLELLAADGATVLASETHLLSIRPPEYRRQVANACWIDSRGRAIVNGKPFLPVGLFIGSCPKDHIDTIADSAFNCIASYSALNLYYGAKPANSQQAIAAIREVMDYFQQKNLKLIFSLQHVYDTDMRYALKQWHEISGPDAIVQAVVPALKDHPALLSWYTNDERPLDFLRVVKQRRDLINSLDDAHPTWSLSMLFTMMYRYAPTGDVLGCDPYPIHSPKPRQMDVVDLAGAMTKRTGMPYWAVPQLYNSSFSAANKTINTAHDPTREEMRAMSLRLASEGATGFIFYHFWNIRNPNIPVPGYFQQRWEDVKDVAATLKSLEPWLLADAWPEPVLCSSVEGKVHVTRFQANDGRDCFIVTANGPGHSQAAFTTPAPMRSLYGLATTAGDNTWNFTADGIAADILWPQ
ncbi:MAG: hypothetical protein GX574_08740 [Lentisphaerae bacterium]|nr:hypothetical protein [Lentisphaerota bacterium]